MKHTLCAAALLALGAATGAQAQPPEKPHDCIAALTPLAGRWEWMERAGARPFAMEITVGAADCSLGVTAWWAHSPFDRYVWQFTARQSAPGESFFYTGARHWHEKAMAPEDAAPPKQEPKYDDGSGALRLQEGGTLLWDESKEGICKECRFRKVAPAVADANVPAVPDALELVAACDISAALRVIGTDGKGMSIVFERVQRSRSDPLHYTVAGKLHTGSGKQRRVRDFSGTLEVLLASLQPRTPANAESYKGYEDGVTRGSIEAHAEMLVGRGQPGSGTIQGTLRVPVLHKADGTIVSNLTLQAALPSDPPRTNHRLLAAGGYADGEFTGTWTEHKSGASTPLTFSRQRFSGSELRVLAYDPKAGVFGEAILHPRRLPPAKPPKP